MASSAAKQPDKIPISDDVYLTTAPWNPGNALYAARDIPAGALIMSVEDPLVAIPDDPHLSQCCSRCLVWRPDATDSSATAGNSKYKGKGKAGGSMMNTAFSDIKLSYCMGCKVVKYCSKTCQQQDWNAVHKKECRIFKQLHPRVLPGSVRCVMRILIQRAIGAILDDGWRALMGLESHMSDIRDDEEKWNMISLMSKGAKEYSKTTLPEGMVRELYCKLLINSLTATTQTFDPVGICFDPITSLINHSCDPNAIIVFENRSMSIRSLKPIDKDTQFTISYVDNSSPRWQRQKELKERFYFQCKCTACVSPEVRYTEALFCQKCQTPMLYEPFDKRHPRGKCKGCGWEPEAFDATEQIEAQEEAAFVAIEKATKALSSPSATDLDDTINSLQQTLKSFYATGMYPPTRQPLPALHQTLAQCYISKGIWASALKHMLTLYAVVDPIQCPAPHHPVRVSRNFTLAMVLLQVAAESPGAVETPSGQILDYAKVVYGLLIEVEGNIDKSYGGESMFAELVWRKKAEVDADIAREGGPDVREWVGKRLAKVPGLEEEVKKVREIVKAFTESFK